jgi:peptide-methionine (S)-S-oxide reductase
MANGDDMAVATLAGGCFWCLDAVFSQLIGVDRVTSGYSGGYNANPTYEQVCSGTTGHAEVVRIDFDPAQISFRQLLMVFFAIHDPTTRNRQGADVGTQYRSAIFAHSAEQRAEAEVVMQEMAAYFPSAPIVTELLDAPDFYPAESYHQGYFAANPGQGYCAFVISPKVAAFRRDFAPLLRNPDQ